MASRRASKLLVVVSLMVAVMIAAVWMRGLFARDQFTTHVAGRKWVAAVFPHHVYVIAYLAPAESVQTSFQSGLTQYPSRPIYWELRYHHRPGGMLRLGVPFWLPLLFAIAPPLWWVIERVRTRRRYRDGLCQECGYDLRASQDRCPECGTPISDAKPLRRSLEARLRHRAMRREPAPLWQVTLK